MWPVPGDFTHIFLFKLACSMISISNYYFPPPTPIVTGGNNSCFQAAPRGNCPIISKIRKTDKTQ